MPKKRSSYFFLLALGILSLRWAVVEPYIIPSESMIPSLLVNDHIVVNKLSFGLRWPFSKKWIKKWGQPLRGDLVVFRSVQDDNYYMIKRIIGLQGDQVGYTESGQLLVNGKPVPQRLISSKKIRNEQDPYYFVSPKDLQGAYKEFSMIEEDLGGRRYRTLLKGDAYRWAEKMITVPEGRVYVMGDHRDVSRDSRAWGTLPIENLLGRAMFVWLSCDETFNDVPYLCNPQHIRWNRFFHKLK